MRHRRRKIDVERQEEKRRRKTLKKNENKIQSDKCVDKVEPYGINRKYLNYFRSELTS